MVPKWLEMQRNNQTISCVKVHYLIMICLFLTKNLPYLVVCGRFQHRCGCQHPHDDVRSPDDVHRCGDDAYCDDDDSAGCGCVANDDVEVDDDAAADGSHSHRTLWPNGCHRFRCH